MRMPDEVLELIRRTRSSLVVTSSRSGEPNIAPKGSLMAVDAETLLYADLFPGRTTKNLMENPKVAVAVIDPETMEGYQIKGRAERAAEGTPYHQACETVAGLKVGLPPPQAVIVIRVEEVYPLTPGPPIRTAHGK